MSRHSGATPTAMLEQAPKSSRLFEQIQKLHMDFWSSLSVVTDMVKLDEIDPQKARSGLFALITARLEDAHEVAVRGQRPEIGHGDMAELLEELVDHINQIEIMIMATGSLRE